MPLERRLKDFLRRAERLVVMLIGNEMRGDDGAALTLRDLPRGERVVVIDCGPVPENFTGVVRRLKPTHVLLVDAVDFGGENGEIEIFDPHQLVMPSFSSHRMSLRLLSRYLESEVGARVILLGIQPKSLELGEGLSPEVKLSVDVLRNLLIKVFEEVGLL
ncbi:MAG: hydrogenase maturation peptidase HycI [Candidatus Verstraetearchaeota archaeon]|nr:hydrogenase maturation peptidase HycI [Candidatus Verstraetearchaeota archaeon]